MIMFEKKINLIVRSIEELKPVLAVRKGPNWATDKSDTTTEYGQTVWKIITDQNASFIIENKPPPEICQGTILTLTITNGEGT